MDVFLTGGRARKSIAGKDEWKFFEAAVVLKLDMDTRALEPVLEYVSPSEACPDEEPSIIFKSGTRLNDILYLCTQTELLCYSLPDLERTAYVSLPCFNDLHHVRPTDHGTLLAVSTGLDLILEVDPSGTILNEWPADFSDTWTRFSRDKDYRKVATTKPHATHANFVFEYGGRFYVTRHKQMEACAIDDPNKRIAIDVGTPHDGEVVEDKVYFTTVDGKVVVSSMIDGTIQKVFDLEAIAKADRPLGWCRGIFPVSDSHALVGFSRLRMTKSTEYLSWLKDRVKTVVSPDRKDWLTPLPTRVVLFDLEAGRMEWEVEVESKGMNALFSII